MRTLTGMAAAMLLATLASLAPAQTTVMLTPLKDNTLYEDAGGGLSNGAGEGFFCGRTGTGARRRALIAFDLSSIPANATVTAATLTLNMSMTISGPLQSSLHVALADWGEGTSDAPGNEGGGALATPGDATWIHTFSNTQFWTNPGGDYAAAASATTTVDALGVYTWSSATMTADVQSWIANPAANFGWLLRSDEIAIFTGKRFDSKDHLDPAVHPVLAVTYTVPPMASATAVGTGCGPGPFTLGTTGLPVLGTTFSIDLAGGPPAALASIFLANGIAANPLPLAGGCFVYLDLPSAIALLVAGVSPIGPVPLDATGALSIPVAVPNLPPFLGFAIDLQVVAVDLAAGGAHFTSNALSLVFGL